MDKSKFYLNLSNCTEEQQRNIFKVLTENNQLLATQLHDIFYFRKYSEFNFYSLLFLNQWKTWQVTDKIHNLKELTYPEFIKLFEGGDNNPTTQLKKDKGAVSVSTDLKKPLIDRVKYELRIYTELAKRMDELMHECNLEADYSGAKEAEIKRNCYNRFINDLKQLVS